MRNGIGDVPLMSIIRISLVDSSAVKSLDRCPELDERSRIFPGGFLRSYARPSFISLRAQKGEERFERPTSNLSAIRSATSALR
jgi:hypothetical protein